MEVGDARPNGEDGGENGGIDRREGNPLEHDPSKGKHLGDGADLSGPMRDDFNSGLVVMKNPKAAHNDDVAGDDEDDEPHGEAPAFGPPRKNSESGEGEEEEAFVGERIEKGSEFGELIELTCEVAVESVGERGDDEDGHRNPAKGFVAGTILNTQTIVDGDCDKERNAQQTKDGDVSGDVHYVENGCGSFSCVNVKLNG